MAQPQAGIHLEHFKVLWDYIKFHLGVYLATPTVLGVLAASFGVTNSRYFIGAWCLMTACCFISGVHASVFMANRVNQKWDENYPFDWEADAVNPWRRRMQHHLYWVALAVGLLGLVAALSTKWTSATA